MGEILWLASYPKSGNTWVRAFLDALQHGPAALDINHLGSPIIAGRAALDEHLGVESSDLSHDEIDALRPLLVRSMARALPADQVVAMKVHDAYARRPDGTPDFGGDGVRGAICIVRDPRDVAISLAHHQRVSLDDAVGFMESPTAAFAGSSRRLSTQVRQRLGTWSTHVAGWVDQRDVPTLVVRFEDLHADPLGQFTRIAAFGGWPAADETAVAAAVEASCFERLRDAEQRRGFVERPPGVGAFFRQGVAGAWRERLSASQVERIEAVHGEQMRRLGYETASASAV